MTTFNPTGIDASLTLSNGNLTVTQTNSGTNFKSVRSTTGKSSGKVYFEARRTTGSQGFVGVGQLSADLSNFVGSGSDSVGWWSNNNSLYNSGGSYATPTYNSGASFVTFAAATWIGVAVDVTARTIRLSADGTNWSDPVALALTGDLYAMAGSGNTGVYGLDINFGGSSFAYTPLAGYTAWDAAAPTGPTINTQPTNTTVTAPNTATFTAAATASTGGITARQWQRSTDNGATWASVPDGTGGTTDSYTTTATAPSSGNWRNGYQVRCLYTDANGTTPTNAATLTVNAAAGATTGAGANEVFRNAQGGAVLAALVIPKVVYLKPDGTTALVLTNQTTDANGKLIVNNAAFTAGLTYIRVPIGADAGTATLVGALPVVAA